VLVKLLIIIRLSLMI